MEIFKNIFNEFEKTMYFRFRVLAIDLNFVTAEDLKSIMYDAEESNFNLPKLEIVDSLYNTEYEKTCVILRYWKDYLDNMYYRLKESLFQYASEQSQESGKLNKK